MKNTWKLAFVAFAMVAFTACNGTNDDATTESENIESTDQVESDMETDMDMEDTTTTLVDSTVNDGVVDDIQEEQPPME